MNKHDRVNATAKRQKKSVKNDITFSVGWKHFQEDKKAYVQVKKPMGGGTRKLKLMPDASAAEVTEVIKNVFFPGGRNKKVNVNDLTIKLASYEEELIDDLKDEDGIKFQFSPAAY